MTTENPPPRALAGFTVDAAHDCLRQLAEALERWGDLFFRMADEAAIRTIVARVQALAVPNSQPLTSNPKGDS